MPTRTLGFKTPINLFNECFLASRLITSIPLKIFGSIAFVHNHDSRRTKFDPKAHKCIFAGYPTNQKGYKCFDPVLKKMFVSMDVTFFEGQSYSHNFHFQGEKNNSENDMCLNDSDLNIEFDCINNDVLPKENEKGNPNESTVENSRQPPLMPSHNQNSGMSEICTKRYKGLVYSKEYLEQKKKRNIVLQHHQESDQRLDHENSDKNPPSNFELNSSNKNDLPIALRKGVRSCTKHPLSNFISYKNVTPSFRAFISQVSRVVIPNNVQEALKVPEWREAIFEEMRALEKNATWEKVDLPQRKGVVGCKWVFTVKYNSDGSLERYKA